MAQRLAIAFRMRAAEVARHLIERVVALFDANDGYGLAAQQGDAAHDRAVVAEEPVAVQFKEILKNRPDELERRGPPLGAGNAYSVVCLHAAASFPARGP